MEPQRQRDFSCPAMTDPAAPSDPHPTHTYEPVVVGAVLDGEKVG